MPHLADQMIVNAYEAGAGISAHIDLSAFDDAIVAISLGSTCVMQFCRKGLRELREKHAGRGPAAHFVSRTQEALPQPVVTRLPARTSGT